MLSIRRGRLGAAAPTSTTEIIRLISETRGISEREARELYLAGQKNEADEIRAIEGRRRRAGNPVFQSRNDFTGQVRR